MDNLRDAVLGYSLAEAEMDGTIKGSSSTIMLDDIPGMGTNGP